MDINLLFKSAEMACGRVLKILPEDEIGSPKQYLQDILETRTMPSLNELTKHVPLFLQLLLSVREGG